MPGYIISVIGGKGGVGKSQVAANLAMAFTTEARMKTILLDFDQKSSGDQNLITGIKGKKTIKDLAEFKGAIDPNSVLQFVTANSSGMAYLGMPNDYITSLSIDVEGLGKSLKALPNLYQIIVIDAGSDLSPIALKALEFSTLIFMVVTPDILAVNQTKRMYTDLVTMMFPKDMMQVILNQAVPGHPVTSEAVGKQMEKAVFATILKDDQTCVAALNKSQPALSIAKSSPFSKGVIECTQKIIQKNILAQLAAIAKPKEMGAKKESAAQGGVDNKKLWLDLKGRIHKALVEEMDLKKSDENDPKARIILKEQTKKVVVDILGKEDTKGIVDTREQMNQMVKEVLDEALGFGPLEDMLSDKTISEIMVVGPHKIFYEQKGKIKLSEVVFTTDRQVMNVIERIVAPIGRRIDEKTPYVDARLPDGSRVHAIIPPCALNGCTITIRKFPDKRLTYKDLVAFGSLTNNMADFLRIAVEGHRNIIVSGGTGSGKTTLINMLGGFIPANERIITCEDSAELNLPQEHVVRLETKPPSLEGEGAVDIRCLVKQTLRMRPDRIMVGECRGGETLDMLQAMGTGHDGSMTTIHANNPREAIGRIETLCQYAGTGLPSKAIREMIANAVHMIVQQSRLDDGSRRITFITELGGLQGEVVILQDIFTYVQKGMDKAGKIVGEYQASGFIPKFVEKLEKKGYNIPRGLFSNSANTAPPQAPPPPAKTAATGTTGAPAPSKPGQGGGTPPVKK